jgi:hypothetical protein
VQLLRNLMRTNGNAAQTLVHIWRNHKFGTFAFSALSGDSKSFALIDLHNFRLPSKLRAQIHGRIKKGVLDGYPSSALPWLPEDPSDILSIFPFLSDRVFEPSSNYVNKLKTSAILSLKYTNSKTMFSSCGSSLMPPLLSQSYALKLPWPVAVAAPYALS